MRPNLRIATLALMAGCSTLVLGVSSAMGAITYSDGSFAADMPLSKPRVTQPLDGTSLRYPTDAIKLAWNPVAGASTYDVQIARQAGTGADCSSATAWQTENILFTHNTADTGWVPELTTDKNGKDIWTGTFCWRVRAAGTKPGLWSHGARFDVSWPARPTNLKFLSDEAGEIPRASAGDARGFDTGYLEWNALDGASRYEVQISEAPTFSVNSLFATKTYPGNRMLLPQMPDNNYSWRVRPIAGNGVVGSWSEVATFTIQRDTRYWTSDSSSLYPAQNATVSDLRFGYEPVPGASYYRYMVSLNASGFTELDSQGPYGEAGPNCSFLNSRLSSSEESKSSTINNWVTLGALLDDAVVKNLATWCKNEGDPAVEGDEFYTRPDIRSKNIHWRVYPVWQVSPATESGWDIKPRKIVGSAVQRTLRLQSYTAADAIGSSIGWVSGEGCRGGGAAMNCNRLIGGSLSPKNSSIHSATMQVPFFEWGAYPGRSSMNGNGPGAFRVQIARDSEFNNQVLPDSANNLIRGWMSARGPLKRDARAESSERLTRFGDIHRSFALTTGLTDEGQDGNGYFWRSLPCQSGDAYDNPAYLCSDYYSDQTEDIWSPGMRFGTPASGALEFRKRVEVSTQVVDNFSGSMPMLRVGPVGASHHGEWQRGIQGADHYEFEIARSPSFDDSRVLKTTVPRIVPWGATTADLLEAGTWSWRVRAVDRDGLTGTWSAASSFSVASPSPRGGTAPRSSTPMLGATVEWNSVPGASQYEIAWSKDASFASDPKTAVTRQVAYHIPTSSPGRYYWRVRSQTGEESFGAWSGTNEVLIQAPTRIPFGISRKVVNVGGTSFVEGKLLVAGTPRNDQRVELMRKTSSCSGRGSYRPLKSGTSGRDLDDGVVRFPVKASRSACYRLAWAGDAGTIHSAPFEIGAKPVVSFRPIDRKVARGKSFCSRIVSKTAITGRLRVQYRAGKAWVTARTEKVTNDKRVRVCAAINRAGTFRVRVVLDRLVHPTTRSKQFEKTTVQSGAVRVNDSFRIIR